MDIYIIFLKHINNDIYIIHSVTNNKFQNELCVSNMQISIFNYPKV